MRSIVYTRRMILAKTKRFIIQNGFCNLTARNLATYMEMSTQPIYKQFDSIQGLQKELVEEYFSRLSREFQRQQSPEANVLEDFAVYFVAKCQKDYLWFTQLFLVKKRNDEVALRVRQCSYELFLNLCSPTQDTEILRQVHDSYLAILVGTTVWIKQNGPIPAGSVQSLLDSQIGKITQIGVPTHQ